jgi:hypothetical protein
MYIVLYTCAKEKILLTSYNFDLFEIGAPLIGATVQLQLHGHGFDSALTQLQIGNRTVRAKVEYESRDRKSCSNFIEIGTHLIHIDSVSKFCGNACEVGTG